jgi:Zn-dependent peptidase ImmA (M78 family)
LTHSPRDEYDPFAHAARLGLRVEYQSLRTAFGLYVPGRDLIMLRPRMRTATERSVLAHEILHYLHDDRRVAGIYSLRQERRADEGAASNLITDARWREVTSWSRDPAEWAVELRVTADILMAYIRTHQRIAA